MTRPRLGQIAIYPVKSLGSVAPDRARIGERGSLVGDREFAMVDSDGEYVNGKRTAAVHRLRSDFDPEARTLRVSTPALDARTFGLDDPDERAALTDRLAEHFGYPVELRRDAVGGYPDDTDAHGPTVISAATLREVASWFPGIDADEMRRRLRPSLVVEGVPAFWEDRLFDDRESVVEFEIGDLRLRGVSPCQRCVVPTRDPDTGEVYEGFRETFVRKRRETMPEWSGGERFDHDYRLMVNTTVPESERGTEIAVGDEVRIVGTRSIGSA